MKARNIITAVVLCAAFATTSMAQQQPTLATNGGSYNTAVGLRAGYTSGLTIKKFVGAAAIEGIIGFWHHGLSATVLYERHVNAFGVNGMNWYYGGGGHASFHNHHYHGRYFGRNDHYYDDGALGLGVDGILGLEYKIPAIPFAISLDIKPFVEVNTAGGAGFAFDSGLGIKVCF